MNQIHKVKIIISKQIIVNKKQNINNNQNELIKNSLISQQNNNMNNINKIIDIIQTLEKNNQKKKMISQQLIKQITGDDQKQRIYKIDLCNHHIDKMIGLRQFTKIRFVQLDFNKISVIEGLENLSDLRQLHIQYNQIAKLNGLENNKMLTVLALSNNRIQKIENIGHLIKLENLIINNNKIQSITGLEMLKDLKYISMSGNKLTSIESLPVFSKLEVLNADHNLIKKISSSIFTKSTKLLKLDLSFNLIQDVTCINGLLSLEQLNISNNRITVLHLTLLKNLQYLNISNNKIQKLPKIVQNFPQLGVLLMENNQIISQFQIIQAFSQAQMLIQVDISGNPMDTPQFSQTLHKLYGFDRVNKKNYNIPGTRYLTKAQQINKDIKQNGLGQIQNDEDVRKIIMSGFFNDQIQTDMTGVKPNRLNSENRNKIGFNINYDDIDKCFNQVMRNQCKIKFLKQQCLYIFQSNNINVNIPITTQQQQIKNTNNNNDIKQNLQMITEAKNITDKISSMTAITELRNKNEEYNNKWKQLKNKQKSFNIRGVVRKASASHRTTGIALKEDQSNKIPPIRQRNQLMKTQINPPRWNYDGNYIKNTQIRALSAKKKDK